MVCDSGTDPEQHRRKGIDSKATWATEHCKELNVREYNINECAEDVLSSRESRKAATVRSCGRTKGSVEVWIPSQAPI